MHFTLKMKILFRDNFIFVFLRFNLLKKNIPKINPTQRVAS